MLLWLSLVQREAGKASRQYSTSTGLTLKYLLESIVQTATRLHGKAFCVVVNRAETCAFGPGNRGDGVGHRQEGVVGSVTTITPVLICRYAAPNRPHQMVKSGLYAQPGKGEGGGIARVDNPYVGRIHCAEIVYGAKPLVEVVNELAATAIHVEAAYCLTKPNVLIELIGPEIHKPSKASCRAGSVAGATIVNSRAPIRQNFFLMSCISYPKLNVGKTSFGTKVTGKKPFPTSTVCGGGLSNGARYFWVKSSNLQRNLETAET